MQKLDSILTLLLVVVVVVVVVDMVLVVVVVTIRLSVLQQLVRQQSVSSLQEEQLGSVQ